MKLDVTWQKEDLEVYCDNSTCRKLTKDPNNPTHCMCGGKLVVKPRSRPFAVLAQELSYRSL